jgi:hypothetical protein
MQNGNFSATIVVNGIEVADQMDATVPIAFGDEYVVRLRTHHGRRAVADIWVDGVHITPDGGVVVPSYGYADVETPPGAPGSKFRFVDSDSHDAHVAGKGGPDINGEKGPRSYRTAIMVLSPTGEQYRVVWRNPFRREAVSPWQAPHLLSRFDVFRWTSNRLRPRSY